MKIIPALFGLSISITLWVWAMAFIRPYIQSIPDHFTFAAAWTATIILLWIIAFWIYPMKEPPKEEGDKKEYVFQA